tara:strand:+ start:2263 stop:3255 length:993 start_codon:yes stop_codon:yes gene_type:complete
MHKLIHKNDTFFVAGASGMAGSAICRKLKQFGYGNSTNKGKILTPTRKELNLLNLSEVNNWLKKHKPSVTIIAAAKVGGIIANSEKPADFLIENLKIQTNLIEASFINGVRRLLFLGSSCIYPKYAKQPIKEESLLTGFLESTNESYAIAKITGIKLCQAYRDQYNFDCISLMPTNLYGPGDNYNPENSHVMASLINKFHLASKTSSNKVTCLGTGSPLREFLHSDDLGEAVIFALEKWDPYHPKSPLDKNGKPLLFLNVGTGHEISIYELAYKIANIYSYKGEICWDKTKPDGTPKKLLDISRLSKMGWTSKINLDKGIKKTILEYQLQ